MNSKCKNCIYTKEEVTDELYSLCMNKDVRNTSAGKEDEALVEYSKIDNKIYFSCDSIQHMFDGKCPFYTKK